MPINDTTRGLLAHIKVLDLADEKASFCSKILADLGSHVIKVEKPGGDPSRNIGPFLKKSATPKESLSFFYNNTNKYGITLDLDRPEGRDVFLRLAKWADVVVESFEPGYLESLNFGFDDLSKINQGLILVSISGFGLEGPRKGQKIADIIASALGGHMQINGLADCPPMKISGDQTYNATSLYAAVGALLAVRKRRKLGRGEHLDISIQESSVATLDHVMVRYFNDQTIAERQGNLHWNNAFCVLPCLDGFIHITLLQQWETLIELLDKDGMAEDLGYEVWKDEEYRQENLSHILEVLEKWTKTKKKEELFELGQLMRFPWAPVSSPADISKSSQLKSRKFFKKGEGVEGDITFKYPGIPYKLGARAQTLRKRAPLIGEDNERIYLRELGMSREQFDKLSSKNII